MERPNPEDRAAERRSMAERAVGGLAFMKERRPVRAGDLYRTLEGYLVARFFKVQRTGGFESGACPEAEVARAEAWQAYLEDAEEGQELPSVLKDPNVLSELAASASAFLDALQAAPHVAPEASAALREEVEKDCPTSLPGLLANLARAIRQLP